RKFISRASILHFESINPHEAQSVKEIRTTLFRKDLSLEVSETVRMAKAIHCICAYITSVLSDLEGSICGKIHTTTDSHPISKRSLWKCVRKLARIELVSAPGETIGQIVGHFFGVRIIDDPSHHKPSNPIRVYSPR